MCGPAIEIEPWQAISIFGWFDQPRRYLSWEDVKNKNLSWRLLRCEYKFLPEKLYELQPDKAEWIKRGQLCLADVADMAVFPINPISDLGADVAEVWNMKWSPEAMSGMGITFEQLHENGMSAQVMLHFGYPLSGWQRLGLRSEHVTQEMARGLVCP